MSARGFVPVGAAVIRNESEGSEEEGSGKSGMRNPSNSRLKGGKRNNIEERREEETVKVVRSAEKMAQALKQVAIVMRQTASFALQLKIGKSIPMSEAERIAKMTPRLEAAVRCV